MVCGVMDDRAGACRKKALECERRAVLATEETVRATYLDLAHQWRDMAEHVENIERQRAAVAEVQRLREQFSTMGTN